MSEPIDYFTLPVSCEVDARELRCPLPLLQAKQAMRNLPEGHLVRILATDGASVRDFRAFCQLSQHELLGFVEHGGVYCYVLKK